MKITQEDVAKVEAAEPRKITADMIAAATAQYEQEKADREAARKARQAEWEAAKKKYESACKRQRADKDDIDAINNYYESAKEELTFFDQLDMATTARVRSSKNMRIISNILAHIDKENYEAQLAILGGNKKEVVARGSDKYRLTVEYDDGEFEVFYGDRKIHFKRLSGDFIAGALTQLLNVMLINASTNTLAYENGEEKSLRNVTIALANFLESLDDDCTRAGVIECCDDNKLNDLPGDPWIDVPKDFLPLGVIDEIDEEVYSGKLCPTEEDIDAMEEKWQREYNRKRAAVEESSEDFHGFTDAINEFEDVWDIHAGRLLSSDYYIDWSCVTTQQLDDPLPYCADDFNVPISTLSKTLSENLIYDLEPYEKDINVNYGDYITPVALYILINGDNKLESGCYTPVFRAALTYENFRKHLASKIIKLFGAYDENDSWAVAEHQDLFEIIEMSIDKAMWSAELIDRDI